MAHAKVSSNTMLVSFILSIIGMVAALFSLFFLIMVADDIMSPQPGMDMTKMYAGIAVILCIGICGTTVSVLSMKKAKRIRSQLLEQMQGE